MDCLKQESDYLPPSPPSPTPPPRHDFSGLKQLAEISLAMAGLTSTHHGSSLSPHSFLTSLILPAHHHSPASLSPSSTPSPPPLAENPQECPLDLRVGSRRFELEASYKMVQDCGRRDSVGTESGESCASDLDLDIDQQLRSSSSNGKGSFTCGECGKCYSSSSNLARHRQTHKPEVCLKACPHCTKEYTSPAALAMHLRTHAQGCKCPFCGKSFSRPWLLQGHIRTHTGEKPFSCNQCNKAFADKSNLRAHTQTHSSDKPYSCGKCGKSFALKSYLSKHEESSCLKLEKAFRKRSGSSLMEEDEERSVSPPTTSSSPDLSLARLLSSPSLLPHAQISEATLQALKMAVFANNKN